MGVTKLNNSKNAGGSKKEDSIKGYNKDGRTIIKIIQNLHEVELHEDEPHVDYQHEVKQHEVEQHEDKLHEDIDAQYNNRNNTIIENNKINKRIQYSGNKVSAVGPRNFSDKSNTCNHVKHATC